LQVCSCCCARDPRPPIAPHLLIGRATFYSRHYSFYAGDPAKILPLTTAEFGAYLKKEWEWTKGEVGSFDYDPWLGAQDGKIGKAGPLFSRERDTGRG